MIPRLALLTLVVVVGFPASMATATTRYPDALSQRSSSGPAIDSIVVDPALVERTIPPTFFGINYVAFWDTAQGSAGSARALVHTPIRSVRFPGGAPADWYDWQNPGYKGWSRTGPSRLWRWARSFGASHVVFGTNYQGHLPNPPGKAYAVNSPENAAAWVRFNKRVGINADMEVGNEEDLALVHRANDPRFAGYIARFNAQAEAMHRANSHVRVMGPVGTNEWYWWTHGELGQFLHGAGNRTGTGQADGVSLHFYRGSNWADAKGVAQYWLSPKGPWAAIRNVIHANDTRNLPVSITEWNLGGSKSNDPFVPTLGHGLATADLIGAYALSGVAEEDYFDLHGGTSFGLLYGKGEPRPVDSPTPTYYAMALWRHMSNRMLSLRQSADPAGVMSAYATRGKNGTIQLLAINKEPVPQTVRLALQGATPAGHHLYVYSLQGATGSVEDLEARYDGVRMPSPQHRLPGAASLGVVQGTTVSYTVPPYSAVVLALDGTSSDPGLRWSPPHPGAPAPALRLTVSGKVTRYTVRAGGTEQVTATVRSNDEMGTVLIDLELYDSYNKKVFQSASMVSLRANRSVSLTRAYTVPAGAHTGDYVFKVGIFGPNWSPLYHWDDNAASFLVIA